MTENSTVFIKRGEFEAISLASSKLFSMVSEDRVFPIVIQNMQSVLKYDEMLFRELEDRELFVFDSDSNDIWMKTSPQTARMLQHWNLVDMNENDLVIPIEITEIIAEYK